MRTNHWKVTIKLNEKSEHAICLPTKTAALDFITRSIARHAALHGRTGWKRFSYKIERL